MDFRKYQKLSRKTNLYKEKGKSIHYAVLGIASEAGEVAGKAKKIIRDKNGIIDKEGRHDLISEMGDVLWYVSQLASELKVSLVSVAEANIKKLAERKKRSTLRGSGDNR